MLTNFNFSSLTYLIYKQPNNQIYTDVLSKNYNINKQINSASHLFNTRIVVFLNINEYKVTFLEFKKGWHKYDKYLS